MVQILTSWAFWVGLSTTIMLLNGTLIIIWLMKEPKE